MNPPNHGTIHPRQPCWWRWHSLRKRERKIVCVERKGKCEFIRLLWERKRERERVYQVVDLV